jgi:hypothetical protein
MSDTNDAVRANGEPAVTDERDDVRGFGPDIAGSLVPSLPSNPPPPPSTGTFITGWPDPVPPVSDPATIAAWKGPEGGGPNR